MPPTPSPFVFWRPERRRVCGRKKRSAALLQKLPVKGTQKNLGVEAVPPPPSSMFGCQVRSRTSAYRLTFRFTDEGLLTGWPSVQALVLAGAHPRSEERRVGERG